MPVSGLTPLMVVVYQLLAMTFVAAFIVSCVALVASFLWNLMYDSARWLCGPLYL